MLKVLPASLSAMAPRQASAASSLRLWLQPTSGSRHSAASQGFFARMLPIHVAHKPVTQADGGNAGFGRSRPMSPAATGVGLTVLKQSTAYRQWKSERREHEGKKRDRQQLAAALHRHAPERLRPARAADELRQLRRNLRAMA